MKEVGRRLKTIIKVDDPTDEPPPGAADLLRPPSEQEMVDFCEATAFLRPPGVLVMMPPSCDDPVVRQAMILYRRSGSFGYEAQEDLEREAQGDEAFDERARSSKKADVWAIHALRPGLRGRERR